MPRNSMSDEKKEQCLLNAKLCRLIEANPCIYDRSSPSYSKKDYVYVDDVWIKIAHELNETVASCKKRWKNIRRGYAGSLNLYKKAGGPNRYRRYYLHNELQFLTKHLLPGRFLEPTEMDENHQNSRQLTDQSDDDDSSCTFEIIVDSSSSSPSVQEKDHVPTPEPEPKPEPNSEPVVDYEEPSTSTQAKKSHQNISEEFPIFSKSQEKDPDAEFLNILLPEMKTMNSRQKILFKGKIFQALEEVFSDSREFPPKKESSVSQSSPQLQENENISIKQENESVEI